MYSFLRHGKTFLNIITITLCYLFMMKLCNRRNTVLTKFKTKYTLENIGNFDRHVVLLSKKIPMIKLFWGFIILVYYFDVVKEF
jgi:hypothetical protein